MYENLLKIRKNIAYLWIYRNVYETANFIRGVPFILKKKLAGEFHEHVL